MAGNNFFDYLNARTAAEDWQGGQRYQSYTPTNSKNIPTQASSTFGKSSGKSEKDGKKGAFARRLKRIGDIGIKGIKESQANITQNAMDYARFLSGQVSRGERSPIEASDLYADFGLAYGVPDTFKTAEQLGSMTGGLAPAGAVERYRPFQTFAAKQLGINLTEKDIKSTEAAARELGKTSPELFSQFLGATLLSSPEYIRKNPLAFAANLPYEGRYGVPYKSGGSFTGTYRFKPSSTVDYS